MTVLRFVALMLSVVALSDPAHGQTVSRLGPLAPYRALVVVETWSDPVSVLVDSGKDEFQPVAALLKAWSIPFDILRLDQQHLDASFLFEAWGDVRYGAVIWVADLPSFEGQNLQSLEQAVQAGTSLLVVNSRVLDPTLERLLGLRFREHYTSTHPLRVVRPHFITRHLSGLGMDPTTPWVLDVDVRKWMDARAADVLIGQGAHPLLTVRRVGDQSSAIWIGTQTVAQLRDSAYWRHVFFRSLLWSFGYLVCPNMDYSKKIIIIIDDWGGADKTHAVYWRYPSMSKEEIHEYIIGPLKKAEAVAVANIVTGFVDRKSGRIVSPWNRKFTDSWGTVQDFASTYRGLKDGIEAGVLEPQSHGWSHRLPDLDSPPGPWWTADLEGLGSDWRWYVEFEDPLREREVPAITQRYRLKRARQALARDFGAVPLSFNPPGGYWSKSLLNHTAKILAETGYGIFHAFPQAFYLGPDLVLDLMGIGREVSHGFDFSSLAPEQWPPHPDGPVFLNVHDRDMTLKPDYLDWLFRTVPAGTTTMSMNQYVAILHASIETSGLAGWQLTFDFDPDYCAYFGEHSSSWRLWLTDVARERLSAAGQLEVTLDDKKIVMPDFGDPNGEFIVIDVQPGLGRHVWKLRAH